MDDMPDWYWNSTCHLVQHQKNLALFIWRKNLKIPISPAIWHQLALLHRLLSSTNPWCQPIGYAIPRDPAIFSPGDASKQGIAPVLPAFHLLCMLPLGAAMRRRLLLPSDHRDAVHINHLEFVALIIGFLLAHLKAQHAPRNFPPVPILHSNRDSTAAIGWCFCMSTSSAVGQNLLRCFAELCLISNVGPSPSQMAGKLYVLPDMIS